jgi:hypothetical protein
MTRPNSTAWTDTPSRDTLPLLSCTRCRHQTGQHHFISNTQHQLNSTKEWAYLSSRESRALTAPRSNSAVYATRQPEFSPHCTASIRTCGSSDLANAKYHDGLFIENKWQVGKRFEDTRYPTNKVLRMGVGEWVAFQIARYVKFHTDCTAEE